MGRGGAGGGCALAKGCAAARMSASAPKWGLEGENRNEEPVMGN